MTKETAEQAYKRGVREERARVMSLLEARMEHYEKVYRAANGGKTDMQDSRLWWVFSARKLALYVLRGHILRG